MYCVGFYVCLTFLYITDLASSAGVELYICTGSLQVCWNHCWTV